ncbi:HAD family hydrolase [Streptomyces sp. NPDC058527]
MTASERLMKLAVLDVDGTLLPGALGLDLAHALAKDSSFDLGTLADIMAHYQHGAISHTAMTLYAHRVFRETFAGLSEEHVASRAEQVWCRARQRVFPYARPALAALQQAGYEIWLISGSPAVSVRMAALDLGVSHWRGTELTVREGRYTGEVTSTPALVGGKRRAFFDLLSRVQGRRVDVGRSLAVGTAPIDIEVFHLVGHPVVFEPDPDLDAITRTHLWPVVDQSTAYDALTTLVRALDPL